MCEYLFTLSALTNMLIECFRRGSGVEAGGILVGPRGSRIVTDAVPSTSHAEREPHNYYQSPADVAVLNSVLKELERSGKMFVGYFHRHPSGMTMLSGGDLETCRRVLRDPDCHLPAGLLMLILTEPERADLPVFPYLVRLRSGRPVVTPVSMSVLPDDQVTDVLAYLDPASGRIPPKESNNEEMVCSGSGVIGPVIRLVCPRDGGRGYRQFDAARSALQAS